MGGFEYGMIFIFGMIVVCFLILVFFGKTS